MVALRATASYTAAMHSSRHKSDAFLTDEDNAIMPPESHCIRVGELDKKSMDSRGVTWSAQVLRESKSKSSEGGGKAPLREGRPCDVLLR
jgi:hypothetical protein